MEERSQGKIKQVVACDHEQILVHLQGVQDELNIPYRTQPGLIALCPVVHHGDGKRMSLGPGLKMGRELVVCDHEIPVNQTGAVNVLQKPVQNGFAPNLQQRLQLETTANTA